MALEEGPRPCFVVVVVVVVAAAVAEAAVSFAVPIVRLRSTASTVELRVLLSGLGCG